MEEKKFENRVCYNVICWHKRWTWENKLDECIQGEYCIDLLMVIDGLYLKHKENFHLLFIK